MIRRLRAKFICINMAIVTVMMLAILGMLLHFTRNDLEQQSIRVMQSVMEDRAYPSRPGEFPRQAKLLCKCQHHGRAVRQLWRLL
mgnify:CR=1 FL=1